MVNYALWSNIKGLSVSKKNGRRFGSCKEDSRELRRVRIIVKQSRIRLLNCIRESIASEMISDISSLGCMSTTSISSVLRISMSKV